MWMSQRQMNSIFCVLVGDFDMKVMKQIIRSRTFWIAILIGILGAVSIWVPLLGILIAALTILGAWMQGYENEESAKHIKLNFLIQEKQHLYSWAMLNEQSPWVVKDLEKRQAEINKQLANLMGN
jgi:hypothetical protein